MERLEIFIRNKSMNFLGTRNFPKFKKKMSSHTRLGKLECVPAPPKPPKKSHSSNSWAIGYFMIITN